MTLSGPVNATIADGQGTGTITNDDQAPVIPSISITGPSVAEGNRGMTAGGFRYPFVRAVLDILRHVVCRQVRFA